MSEQIVYNHAAVSGLTSDIATQASQLMDIHDDVLHITQSLAEFFQGTGATAFFDAQQQMLHGLQDMIQTVSLHGHTVGTVHENTIALDNQLPNLFG